jgi:hypothetical protein
MFILYHKAWQQCFTFNVMFTMTLGVAWGISFLVLCLDLAGTSVCRLCFSALTYGLDPIQALPCSGVSFVEHVIGGVQSTCHLIGVPGNSAASSNVFCGYEWPNRSCQIAVNNGLDASVWVECFVPSPLLIAPPYSKITPYVWAAESILVGHILGITIILVSTGNHFVGLLAAFLVC